jgi:NADH:ubiquinone oxidoreductase subunit 4 (subunit M)
MIVSVIYALWMMQRVFQGPNERNWQIADLSGREMAIHASLIAVIVWLGVYSRPVLDTFRPAMENLQRTASQVASRKSQVFDNGLFQGPVTCDLRPGTSVKEGGTP